MLKFKILAFREGPWGGCILQWTIMEVTLAIVLGFEKCYCIQFLTFVEYNKKGLIYVKLTDEVYKHKKNTSKIMNVQLIMDFTILVKQSVMNYKILDMDFYMSMSL